MQPSVAVTAVHGGTRASKCAWWSLIVSPTQPTLTVKPQQTDTKMADSNSGLNGLNLHVGGLQVGCPVQ